MTRLPCLTEAEEGKVLVAYLRTRNIKFTHVPNETGHSPEAKRRAIRMKQQGTSKGFPDYVILVSGSMLFVELKRVRGSATSPEQHAWIKAINEISNCQAIIARGANEAIDVIESLTMIHPTKERIVSVPTGTKPIVEQANGGHYESTLKGTSTTTIF